MSDRTPTPPSAEVFTGADYYPAVYDPVLVGVLGVLGILVLRATGGSLQLLLGAAVLVVAVAAVAAGARFRLKVSAEGIELVNLRAWILLVRRRQWLLDARVELYESLDADAPQGLCVEEANRTLLQASECFGPARESRVRALHASVGAALERQRAAAPPCSSGLAHARLGPRSALLDFPAAVRHPTGRLHEVRSVGRIDLGATEIPPGSIFRFNEAPFVDPRFIDPRRDDFLVEVQVAEPVVVYGRETSAGAVLRFCDQDRPLATRNAFDRDIEIDSRRVRGDGLLGFRTDGRLDAFTLARELRVGGLTLPEGSKLRFRERIGRDLPSRWTCWLGAALALPETTLSEGDSCELSPDLTRLTAISPRNDIVLPRGRLRGGVMPIPVTPDGQVEIAACRKLGLLV
jgi:hypothetical protein